MINLLEKYNQYNLIIFIFYFIFYNYKYNYNQYNLDLVEMMSF